jgi:hypothetical protein
MNQQVEMEDYQDWIGKAQITGRESSPIEKLQVGSQILFCPGQSVVTNTVFCNNPHHVALGILFFLYQNSSSIL